MSLTGASPGTMYESTDIVRSLPRAGQFDRSPAQQFFANGKGGGSGKGTGTVSPQWGWYVSTTPPLSQFVKEEVGKKKKNEGESGLAMALEGGTGEGNNEKN